MQSSEFLRRGENSIVDIDVEKIEQNKINSFQTNWIE